MIHLRQTQVQSSSRGMRYLWLAESGSTFKAWYTWEFLKEHHVILQKETTEKVLSKIQKLQIPRWTGNP